MEVGPVVAGPTAIHGATAIGIGNSGLSLAGGRGGLGLAGGKLGLGLAGGRGGYHKREAKAEASGYGAAPACFEVRDRVCKQIPVAVPVDIQVRLTLYSSKIRLESSKNVTLSQEIQDFLH